MNYRTSHSHSQVVRYYTTRKKFARFAEHLKVLQKANFHPVAKYFFGSCSKGQVKGFGLWRLVSLCIAVPTLNQT